MIPRVGDGIAQRAFSAASDLHAAYAKDERGRTRVTARVRSLPVLLASSGLVQTVGLLQAKAGGQPDSPDGRILRALEHIAGPTMTLANIEQIGQDGVSYRRLARKLEIAAHWLKRGLESLGADG